MLEGLHLPSERIVVEVNQPEPVQERHITPVVRLEGVVFLVR